MQLHALHSHSRFSVPPTDTAPSGARGPAKSSAPHLRIAHSACGSWGHALSSSLGWATLALTWLTHFGAGAAMASLLQVPKARLSPGAAGRRLNRQQS